MMRNKYDIVVYWSLKEVINNLEEAEIEPYGPNSFTDFISYADYPNAPLWTGNNHDLKPYIQDLWNLLYSRYYRYYCVKNNSIALLRIDCKEFITNLINIIAMTYDRYTNLLKIYKDNESHLLDRVKTVSDTNSKFNDTPQDGAGEDYGTDEYLTNITRAHGETESDADTLMNRIKEIENSYSNLLKNWTNEFDILFIEGGNI